MGKTLAEYLHKYQTEKEEFLAILSRGVINELRVDKENRCMEIKADFDGIVPKKDLYALENEIAARFSLRSFRIFPHYPSALFSKEYLPSVLQETERIGRVAHGFFGFSEITADGDNIGIEIPFGFGGISILEMAQTATVIENIIKSEFDLVMHVKITSGGTEEERAAIHRTVFEADLQRIDAAARAAATASAQAATAAAKPELKDLPRLDTLVSEELCSAQIGETVFQSGYMRFDTAGAKQILGEEFEFTVPVPMRRLQKTSGTVVVMGRVFSIESKETRKGDKINVTVGLTDNDASIMLRGAFSAEEAGFADNMKIGKCYAVYGRVRKDDFYGEHVMRPLHIAEIAQVMRTDNAENKRVELHMHTVMSQMDALIDPEEAIAAAKRWGHTSIAVTDHGNVQSFPEMMLAAEKIGGVKVIYGMEA